MEEFGRSINSLIPKLSRLDSPTKGNFATVTGGFLITKNNHRVGGYLRLVFFEIIHFFDEIKSA